MPVVARGDKEGPIVRRDGVEPRRGAPDEGRQRQQLRASVAVVQVAPNGIEDGGNDQRAGGDCAHLRHRDLEGRHDVGREGADEQPVGLMQQHEEEEDRDHKPTLPRCMHGRAPYGLSGDDRRAPASWDGGRIKGNGALVKASTAGATAAGQSACHGAEARAPDPTLSRLETGLDARRLGDVGWHRTQLEDAQYEARKHDYAARQIRESQVEVQCDARPNRPDDAPRLMNALLSPIAIP